MKVKELLMATAEDLRRDRYSQGSGLVSLARALYGNAVLSGPPTASGGGMSSAAMVPSTDSVAQGGAGQLVPQAAMAPSSVTPLPRTTSMQAAPPRARRFSVAMSYAGESITYVKKVVYALRHANVSRDEIFFDKYYDDELLAADLDSQLINFYGQESELIAVFVSKEYASKDWTGVEWRVVKDLIKRKQGHRVMLLRFDDTPLPGWLSIDVYLDLRNRDPEEVADKILERLPVIRKLDKSR
jgi:hypothetical protein